MAPGVVLLFDDEEMMSGLLRSHLIEWKFRE